MNPSFENIRSTPASLAQHDKSKRAIMLKQGKYAATAAQY
jgi:hypothetical protein